MLSPDSVHDLARVCKRFLDRYQYVEDGSLDLTELDLSAMAVGFKAAKAVEYLLDLRAKEIGHADGKEEFPF